MRRTKTAFLSVSIACLLLIVCSVHAKEITFLTTAYSAQLRSYLESEVIPEYKRLHGADVTILAAGWVDRMEKILVMTAGGTPPDVIVTGSTSPYEEGSIGLLAPLDKYLAGWKYTNDYAPSLWQALSWRGQVMVIPQKIAPRGMAYNKELFAEAGLDPQKPPQSWETLIDYTKRLTKLEGDRVAVRGFTVHFTGAGGTQHFSWFLRQAGVSEVDEQDLTSNLLAPEASEALETLRELFEAGQNALPILSGGFERGRMAMHYKSPHHMAAIQSADPAFLENNFALFAPRRDINSTPVMHLFMDGLAITNASRNKDLAWEFISMLCNDEVTMEVQRIDGFYCGRTEMLRRLAELRPQLRYWMDLFPYAQASIFPPGDAVNSFSKRIEQVYRRQTSPLAVLEETNKDWNRLLAEWKEQINLK